MPLYDLKCLAGHRSERHIPLSEFDAEIFCACGEKAFRMISRPMFMVDHTGYNCPITGAWIGSKREHRENLARNDCRVLETGEKEETLRRRAAEEAEFEKKLDETVERTFDSWDSGKKESLYNEVVNGGLDLAVERG